MLGVAGRLKQNGRSSKAARSSEWLFRDHLVAEAAAMKDIGENVVNAVLGQKRVRALALAMAVMLLAPTTLAGAISKTRLASCGRVRTKMDGCRPRVQSLPALLVRLYESFPHRSVPSELGEHCSGAES